MDPTAGEFTVGWICALPKELTASRGMLDEAYNVRGLQKHARDTNSYCLGKIAGHNVVLTCLEEAGTNHASSAVSHMWATFPNLKFGLMVGIGGGVPSNDHDIRLGDVVVSKPSGGYGGVIPYDSGKYIQNGEFVVTGNLRPPPEDLLKAARLLVSNHEMERNRLKYHIENMLQRHENLANYGNPGREYDQLFKAEYVHEGGDSCAACDERQLVVRNERAEDEPITHHGNIASGNSVMRDGLKRDHLGKIYLTLCVEMEAAGLMNQIDCLVIRGVCDYADSHKNKHWQRYAAATAAAYAKELLAVVTPVNVEAVRNTPPSEYRPFSPMTQFGNRLSTGSEHSLPLHPTQSSPPMHSSPPTGAGEFTSSSTRKFSSPESSASRFAEGGRSSSIPRARIFFEPRPSAPAPPIDPPPRPGRSATHQESLAYALPLRAHDKDSFQPRRSATHQPSLSHPPNSSPRLMGPSPRTSGVDRSRTSVSSSIVGPPTLATGAWEGRQGEVILTKDISLMLYRFYGPRPQMPDIMQQCCCRIFELVDDDRFPLPTRRIAIRSLHADEQCVSYWMPLDDVHVEIIDCQITISWSDCSHLVPTTRNYQTEVTCEFDPRNRNRNMVLECGDPSGTHSILPQSGVPILPNTQVVTQRLAYILLYPTLGVSHYEQSHLAAGSPTKTLILCKHRTGATESSDWCTSQHPDFAILVVSGASDSSRYSKVYFDARNLDFRMDRARDILTLKNMRHQHYASSISKPTENDLLKKLDPEGSPERPEWRTGDDLSLSSAEFEDLTATKLMKMLTGWQLLFSEEALNTVLKTGHKLPLPKKIKGAQVMIWEREAEIGKDLQFLIRDPGAETGSNVWLSVSLTKPPAGLTSVEGKSVIIQAQACQKGPSFSIHEMSVVASSSAPKDYNVVLNFKAPDHASEIHDIIKHHLQSLRQRRATTVSDQPHFRQNEIAPGLSSQSTSMH